MPAKIKMMLGAMVGAAVLIVAAFYINILPGNLGANILKTFDSGALSQNSAVSGNKDDYLTESDIDKDGLSDYEEVLYATDPLNSDTDGDGFLDGEEVVSRRNPLVPGPNDELIDNNLTQKMSELAISGLIEGSLKPSSPNYIESLNLVVDEILYQSELNLFFPQVSIKVVPDSEESLKKYSEETLPKIETMIDKEGQSVLELADIVDETDFFDESKLVPENSAFLKLRSFADKKTFELKQEINLLENAPAPKTLEELHRSIIKTFKSLTLNYGALSKSDSDSIQAMLAFGNIINILINDLPAMTFDFYNSIKK